MNNDLEKYDEIPLYVDMSVAHDPLLRVRNPKASVNVLMDIMYKNIHRRRRLRGMKLEMTGYAHEARRGNKGDGKDKDTGKGKTKEERMQLKTRKEKKANKRIRKQKEKQAANVAKEKKVRGKLKKNGKPIDTRRESFKDDT